MSGGLGSVRYLPFAPRSIEDGGLASVGAFRLKVYEVNCESEPIDRSRFAGSEPLLAAALPKRLSPAGGRPGVGFVIHHQGRTGDYLVLAWWDRENELPMRVWVREAGSWRPARDGESICVWDIEILFYERTLWTKTVLSGRPLAAALPDYLAGRYSPSASRLRS
jgi:hypothetical protein